MRSSEKYTSEAIDELYAISEKVDGDVSSLISDIAAYVQGEMLDLQYIEDQAKSIARGVDIAVIRKDRLDVEKV